MQIVDLEWRHLTVGGATCERCGSTGAMLRQLVAELDRECSLREVRVRLRETPLAPDRITESNQILINGRSLEAVGPSIRVGSSPCQSCGELTGQAESCRTLELDGLAFEMPPAYLIRSAVCRLGNCC